MENSIDADVVRDSSCLKIRGHARQSIRVWIIMEDVSIIVQITMEEHNVNVIQDSIFRMIGGRVLVSSRDERKTVWRKKISVQNFS